MILRRGVILPAVLFVLLLLGLLAAMFSMRVNADLASTRAQAIQLQTRLAAEAGIDRIKLLLRSSRMDVNAWYDNPDELHRILVWGEVSDTTSYGTNEEFDEGTPAYRFSIVADDPTDDEDFVRFGITDEASKLNLNTATAAQLLRLLESVVGAEEGLDSQLIVDAIIDWRDSDRNPCGQAVDTEGDYYKALPKPYLLKNGLFDTVEELLLVKGVTAKILYGEDVDRNGLLTQNENDGDLTFPPDDQDGSLNRGLYPFLTVHSLENNVSNDQRPRVYLRGDEASIREQLAADFEFDPAALDYIITATRTPASGGRGGAGRGNARGGASGQNVPPPGQQPIPPGGAQDGAQNLPGMPGVPPPSGRGGRREQQTTPPAGAGSPSSAGEGKEGLRQQRRQNAQQGAGTRIGGRQGGGRTPHGEELQPGFVPPVQRPTEENQAMPGSPDEETPSGDAPEGREDSKGGTNSPSNPRGAQETNDGTGAPQPIRTPASLLREQTVNGQVVPSPLGPEHLAVLLDRTTLEPPTVRQLKGLINVNTAPREVLRCLDGLGEDQVEAIVRTRDSLEASVKSTPAWLLTEGIVDLETFEAIAPQLTARGQQFTIESLGYADHLGTVTRLQVVVDLIGPLTQTLYYRDISYLGGRYPIREKDQEKRRRVR